MHLKEDSTYGLKFCPVLPCLGGQRQYREGRICHHGKDDPGCMEQGGHWGWVDMPTSRLRSLAESSMYKRGRLPPGCEHEQVKLERENVPESMEARRPNRLEWERRCGHSSRWS